MKRQVFVGLVLFSLLASTSLAQQPDSRGIRITPQDKPAPAPNPPPPPPPQPPQPRPRVCEKGDITFNATDEGFDHALARLASPRPAHIVIDVAEPFPADQPPPTLKRWLYEIQKSGGSLRVTALPCDHTRGLARIFQAIIDFAHDVAKAIKNIGLYNAAHDYNATLYFSPGADKLISKVEFTRRDPDGSGR